MASKMGDGQEVELDAVQARIERWRRIRPKRCAMPEELWADALTLCSSLGVHPVARRLRLNYDRLKLRMAEAELRALTRPAPVPPGFVELPATSAVRRGPVSVAEVELSRPDGARLTFRMADRQEVDLAELSGAFFGGGR